MKTFSKFILIIFILIVIFYQFIAFVFLDSLLRGNAHIMSRAEVTRFYLNEKMTNEQFQSFKKTKYLKLYNNSKNADSVTYYYKLMDSMYLKEMRDSEKRLIK